MDIKELIDLYWNGSTTIDEERKIHSFFITNKNLPPELEQWRDWFTAKEAINNLKLDNAFNDKVLSKLSSKKKSSRLKHITWLAAASVAIFLIFSPHKEAYVIDQNEYEILKELLYFTSSKMNQAEEILDENMKKINNINEYINK